jgi:phosphoribosylanthranilate isomerase
LIDTFHSELFGGTGQSRRLDTLRALDLRRVFVSGGLAPGNVAEAAALNPYALDVASGVESSPGLKDADKLASFIANAKSFHTNKRSSRANKRSTRGNPGASRAGAKLSR